jgi:hypothetical protein
VINKRWTLSPVPVGCDKRTIALFLEAIHWNAVPLKPLGATTYLVGGSDAPPTEIIENKDGDILVKLYEQYQNNYKSKTASAAASSSVEKPLDFIVTGGKLLQDPWQGGKDPWGGYNPRFEPKVVKAPPVTPIAAAAPAAAEAPHAVPGPIATRINGFETAVEEQLKNMQVQMDIQNKKIEAGQGAFRKELQKNLEEQKEANVQFQQHVHQEVTGIQSHVTGLAATIEANSHRQTATMQEMLTKQTEAMLAMMQKPAERTRSLENPVAPDGSRAKKS